MANRIAVAGLLIALGSLLLHVPGFGYDEARRPLAVLGAALVLACARSGPGTTLTRLSDLGLLVLAGSALFAVNRTDAVAALFPAIAAWILLRATALGWIPRPFLERHGLLILSALGIHFAGWGLGQHLAGGPAVSSLGNTNYAGILSAVLALAGLAGAFLERGWRRLPGGAAGILGALHVVASHSLAGLLGLAAGFAVLAALLIRRIGWKPVTLVALVLLAAAALERERLGARAGGIARGEDRTARVRLGLWKGTAKLAAAHPILGCGTGNFRMEFPPHRDAEERRLSHEGKGLGYVEAEDPHNTYLAVLSESGPVALLALLAILAVAIARGVRPSADGLAVAGAAGLAALAVSAMFNSLSSHLAFGVVAALLAGAASPAEEAGPPRWRWPWAVAAALLAVAPFPWFLADLDYREAMHTSRPDERLVASQRAVEALPGHWEARYQIAKCWRAMGKGEGSAQAALREVLSVHPHHVPALIELSVGRPPEEQEELLLHAERIAPEYIVIQTRLAGADLRRRDYSAARRRLERILQAMPEEPETLYTIARTWLMERKPEEAIPWLRRALQKDAKIKDRLAADHPEYAGDSRLDDAMK